MFAELFIFTFVLFITWLFFNYRERVYYFQSFKRRGIPGPEPTIWLGNYSEYKKNKNKTVALERWSKQFGKVFGYYYGRKRYICLTDLDMISEVFIKNMKLFYNREDFALDAKYLVDSVLALKNKRWAEVRRLITPIFSYTKVHSGVFDSEIKSCLLEFNKEITKRINEGNLIDLKGQKSVEFEIHDLTQAFTLDVISRTSFGLKEKVYEPDNHMMNIVKEYFQFAGNVFVEIAMLIPVMKNILTYVNNNVSSGRLIDMMTVRLKEHIKQLLKNHEISSSTNEKDQTDVSSDKLNQNKAKVLMSLFKNLANKSISENEFIGNILLILLAGYETLANSETTAFYLLAKHPDIQERLREDIKKDGLESKYLDMFWNENLRKYPPVTIFVTRKASEDCVINGIQFLKDDIVQAPVWLVHHDPAYWPEPYVFKPERFEPEEKANHHPCQFLTFGLGHKNCIGSNFANHEAKLLLANILKDFKIETCENTPEPLEFITPTVINNPSKPVFLRFSKVTTDEKSD